MRALDALDMLAVILGALVLLHYTLRAVDWAARAVIVRYFLAPDECRFCLRHRNDCVCSTRTYH